MPMGCVWFHARSGSMSTGPETARSRIIRKLAEPAPTTIPACSTAVGARPASRISPTSRRDARCAELRGPVRLQAAEVDDAAHVRGGRGEGGRGAAVAFDEVRAVHGVHEVEHGVDANARRVDRRRVGHVAAQRLDPVRPGLLRASLAGSRTKQRTAWPSSRSRGTSWEPT